MGDYAHLTVDHIAMLFPQHRSFWLFSNQGFEASHKKQSYIPVLQIMILQLKASQVNDISIFVSCGTMCVQKRGKGKNTL